MWFERWFLKHSFKHKTLAIAVLSSSLALILMSVFIFIYNLSTANNELVEKIQIQADILSQNSAAALVFKDKQTAEKILTAVAKDDQISFVALYDLKNHSLFADYSNDSLQKNALPVLPPDWRGVKYNNDNIQIVVSVIWNDEELGLILIQTELFKLRQMMINQALIILGIFILSIILAYILSTKLQKLVTDPINKLVATTQKIAGTKDYSIFAVRETEDELGLLVDSFNHMIMEIKSSTDQLIEAENALKLNRDQLQKQVSEQTQELRLSMEEAKQSSQAKSDFLANMSHEIRTPMNAIIGMSHLALQTKLSLKQKKYLQNIELSGHSLLLLINDILDLSKIEARKLTIESVPFQIETVMNNLSSQFYFQMKDKGLDLSIDIDADIPDVLLGDSLRLTQILTNLSNNALKFTQSGYVKLSVKQVELTDKLSRLEFQVIDSGIGMSKEQKEHLFEAFTQGDTSTTRLYGGTGLGLNICKHLTKMMDGELRVESDIGKGSCFIFKLPFLLCDVHVLRSYQDSLLHNSPDDLHSISGAKILLVEDNEMNQLVAQELLNNFQLSIHVANNGIEAIKMVQQENYDLVLMDIQMPLMDGYRATQQIRQLKQFKDLPIIAMTANVMNKEQNKCLDVGMNGFIAKPINPDELYSELLKWIKATDSSGGSQSLVVSKPEIQIKHTILAVDDMPEDLALLNELIGADYNLRVAVSGKKALQLIEKSPPDLILLDVIMPEMNGYEACMQLKQNPLSSKIPIIFLTSKNGYKDKACALSLGAIDYITKPVNPSVLRSRIRTQLNLLRLNNKPGVTKNE